MINSTNETHFDIQKSIAENEVCCISQFFLALLLYHPLGPERMACSIFCTLVLQNYYYLDHEDINLN